MSEKRHAEEKRNKIYAAFLDCMEDGTYESITTRQIAERSGLSYSALYYYFKNKEDILFSYYREYSNRYVDAIKGTILARPKGEVRGLSPAGLAEVMWGAAFEDAHTVEDSRTEMNFLALALRNEQFRDYYEESERLYIDGIEWAISYCQVPTEDPKALARSLNMLMMGGISQMALRGEREEVLASLGQLIGALGPVKSI